MGQSLGEGGNASPLVAPRGPFPHLYLSSDASKLQEQDRQRADVMMRRAKGAVERNDWGGGAAKP